MKNKNKYLAAVPVFATVIVMGLSSCTKHDQILDLTTAANPTPVLNTDTLIVAQGTANLLPIGGAAWDGTIDAVWANAPALTVHAVVPDVGNNTFTGFVGNYTDIKLRSLRDADNIYFLAEFNASNKAAKSPLWYFNPDTHRWAQEAEAPTLNPDGVTYRPASVNDRFLMAFNVANSTPGFNTKSCYAACHVNSSFGDPITPAGSNMYTNGPNEILDAWMIQVLQAINCNQGQDTYIDWASGLLNADGKVNDSQANDTDGTFDNLQTLAITGTATNVDVPLWVIPAGDYNNSAIPLSATLAGGAAVKVIAVSSNGVLTLDNSTTINPNTGTDYMQIDAGDGPKCIPGIVVSPFTGSLGDITSNAFYTGTGWKILMKRALNTNDAAHDVNFSTLADQPFGVGVMFNGADNEHAIAAGLTLHFQK